MGKEVEVTLYYANWCGHCVTFKPEWKKFKKNIGDINEKDTGVKIQTKEHEHSELEKMGGGKINDEDISGYPTLKIKLTKGKDSKEYDYGDYGKRDGEYMTKFIKNLCGELAK
jgi:hypothetical protein